MDSLKSLLDQKKYDLVLTLTEGSTSPNDLFYRISAFIYLGKYEDALYVIQDNQSILETNLVSLVSAHINLLCILGRFEQAYSVLDYYNNLPYQSQAVEELLKKMPQVIALEEKKNTQVKYYDDEQVEEMLQSQNPEDVLLGLDIVRKRDVFTFLPFLEKVMVNFPKQSIRNYTLMLLVQKEVDRSVKVNHLGEIIEVNPKLLTPPFTSVQFNEVLRNFDREFKDPTLSQTATQLFSEYALYLYPRDFKYSTNELTGIFYLLAKEYINDPVFELEDYCDANGLDIFKISSAMKEIKEILADF